MRIRLRLRLICIKGVFGHPSTIAWQGVPMSGRPSFAFLCFAYGGASSTSWNSYAQWRFPPAEERVHAGSGPVERICALLCVGGLRAPDPSVVRQCPLLPRQGLGAYMKFIYRGRFFAVEFLWGPGPLSRRYERIPSCFPERDRLRASPRQRSSADVPGRLSHDVRISAARRGAGRDRPDPGRASGRGGGGHSDASGIWYGLSANVHLRNRPLQNGSAPTVSICESLMLRAYDDLNFAEGSA